MYEFDRSDGRPETVVAAHEPGEDASLSEEIALLVDEHAEGGRGELRSLGEFVDPDALDDLFVLDDAGEPRAEAQLAFRYEGFHIAVDSEGLIQLRRVA